MLRPLFLVISVVLLATLSPPSAVAQDKANSPAVPQGIVYEGDVNFGLGGDVKLTLDLARPEKQASPAPCIVIIHGGGWKQGSKAAHQDAVIQFAKRGYVAATVQYRLVPTARFPSQIEDVKCEVRFLRANADKHKIDKDRFGAIGFSAGAHLSMLLGTMDKQDGLEGEGGHADQSSKVQAVVAFFGPTDLAQTFPPAVGGMITGFLGHTLAENPEVYKAASPITYVNKGDAPTLIYQGTKDQLVPYAQAILMAEAMTKHGVPGRVELLIGADHGWGGAEIFRTLEGSIDFFNEHLKHKPAKAQP